MTTAVSSSDKKRRTPKNRRFWNSAFFIHTVKTGWPGAVLLLAAVALTLVIPFCSYITGQSGLTFEGMRLGTFRELNYTGLRGVAVSMAAGLVCGMTTMRYLNRKVSVNFYHSLPIRREALFTTSALHGILSYIAAYTFGIGICFAVAVVRFGDPGFFAGPALLSLFYGILFFLAIYSVTLFAATLAGTGFMRLVIAGYVLFLPVVSVMLFVLTAHFGSIHGSIIDLEYYGRYSTLAPLCLPLRFAGLIDYGVLSSYDFSNYGPTFKSPLNGDVLVIFISTVLFFAAAIFFYTRRHSEESTKPVVKKWAEVAIKYITVFIGATFFGLIFYFTTTSRVWMCVGILFGAVLLQMITSGVLHKSARAIFKGVRGFAICLGVIVVVTCVFYLDLFGITSSIPNPGFVNSVEVQLEGSENVEFKGDYAGRVTRLLKNMYSTVEKWDGVYMIEQAADEEFIPFEDVSGKKYSGYDATFITVEEGYDTVSVSATFKTKFGIPLAMQFYCSCETAEPLAELMFAGESGIPEGAVVDDAYVECGILDIQEAYGSIVAVTKENYTDLLPLLSDPAGDIGTSPIVAYLAIRYYYPEESVEDITRHYMYMNITAADTEAIEWLFPGAEEVTEEGVIRDIIDYRGYDAMCIVNCDSGQTEYFTDKADMYEVAGQLDSLLSFNPGRRAECRKDHSYNVYFMNIDESRVESDRYWFNEKVIK